MENSTEKTIHNKNSPWNYFDRSKDGIYGICKISGCQKPIKSAGGTTTGLRNHLKTQHKIVLLKRNAEQEIGTSSSSEPKVSSGNKEQVLNITSIFENKIDNSFEATVARMTTLDGIPFSRFTKSVDLKRLLKNAGYDIPKSNASIKNIVMKYFENIRRNMIIKVSKMIQSGERFSATFDVWTSTRNRRYLNLNLHSRTENWSLGIVRILAAEQCVEVVKKRLEEFNISIKHIVAITSDGAAVMVKVGKLLDPNQQLCHAHGIQLAVINILYQRNISQPQADIENYDNTADDDSDDDNFDGDNGFEIIQTNEVAIDESNEFINSEIYSLIKKIRKVVSIFGRSPIKNHDSLQKYVREENGRELFLILDTPTRWTSLLDMLERFNQIKNPIKKCLIDIKSDIDISDAEFHLLSNVISTMLIIKVTVEKLCSRDINLYTADIALKFMLDQLEQQPHFLSNAFLDELVMRIKQRRTPYSDVFLYLNNPHDNETWAVNYGIFNQTSRAGITKIIIEIVLRLADENEHDFKILLDSATSQENVVQMDDETLTLKEQLNLKIKNKLNVNEVAQISTHRREPKDLTRIIKREMLYFEDIGSRGVYLESVFNYLCTIRPTSVESERAFSAAGLFCTKIRSRLSDASLNALCYLRSHFLMNHK